MKTEVGTEWFGGGSLEFGTGGFAPTFAITSFNGTGRKGRGKGPECPGITVTGTGGYALALQ